MTAARRPFTGFLLALPLLGWMLREVARDPVRGLPLFVLNLVLGITLAALTFGGGLVMVIYFALAPAVLILIMLMSADFGRSI